LLRARPFARHGSRWAAFSHRSCRRSVGFCDPRLAFSKLNGYSHPAGIWLYESQGRLVMNQSSGNPAGVPFGQPWAVRANVSATIVGGDHSASVLEFALDGEPHDIVAGICSAVFSRGAMMLRTGVVQGHAELPFEVPPAGGLLGCAAVCCNGTVLSLRGA